MANKKLSAVVTLGGTVSSSLRTAFGAVTKGTEQIGKAVKTLETRQRELNAVMKEQAALGRTGSALKVQYAQQELAILDKQLAKMRQIQTQQQRIDKAKQANLARRGELRGQIFDTVAIGAAAASPIVAAARFETAMLGVARQVDGARDAGGNLTSVYRDMAKQVQQLGREIPIATNELAEMVAAGARMGIQGEKNLISFTRTAAMMADAFELPAAQLADDMGKIAGLFKIPIPAIGELADAVNYLDDNAISKGGDIIEFLTRTGGVAAAVKVTGQEMAALGSTLLTLGERTETAGTATNAMFSKLAAADKGTKKFKRAMKEIGLSTAAVQKGMQTDAVGTLLKVLQAVGKLKPEKQLGALVDLVGMEHADTLAKLANNTEEFGRQLKLANSEAAKGSMGREFAARLQTTTAQFQIMKNQVSELAVNLGTVLLPAINGTFKALSPVVNAMATFAQENPRVTQAIVGTVVAVTSLNLVLIASKYAWTFFKGGAINAQAALLKFRTTAMLLGAQLPMVAGAIRAVGLAMVATPIGAIIAGIAAAGILIHKYWHPLKAFFTGFFTAVSAGLAPIGEAIASAFEPITKVVGPIIMPILTVLGDWIKSAATWFGDLFTPIDECSKTTAEFGNAGEKAGKFVADAFTMMLSPITKVFDLVTKLTDTFKVAFEVYEKLVTKGDSKIGAAWAVGKAVVTGDTSGISDRAAALPGSLPAPAMATARGAGSNYTDNSQTTLQIVQRPGESNRDLARRITEEQERRKAVQRRGVMIDGATAQ